MRDQKTKVNKNKHKQCKRKISFTFSQIVVYNRKLCNTS